MYNVTWIYFLKIHPANLLHSSTVVSLFPHFQSRHLSNPNYTILPLTLIAFSRVVLGQRKNPCQRSSPSAWWSSLHPSLHYCLSCNFLSSGYHLVMQICSCAGHLVCVECDVYRHGDGCWGFRPGQSLLPLSYLTQPSSLSSLCLPWCAMMCTQFINSSCFSHQFYIIKTFRLALNQCWHGTRGTTLDCQI